MEEMSDYGEIEKVVKDLTSQRMALISKLQGLETELRHQESRHASLLGLRRLHTKRHLNSSQRLKGNDRVRLSLFLSAQDQMMKQSNMQTMGQEFYQSVMESQEFAKHVTDDKEMVLSIQDALEGDLQQCHYEHKMLRENIHDMIQIINQVQDECRELRKQIEVVRYNIRRLLEKNHSRISLITDLQPTVEAAAEKLASIEQSILRVNNGIEGFNKEVNDLKANMDHQLQKGNEVKQDITSKIQEKTLRIKDLEIEMLTMKLDMKDNMKTLTELRTDFLEHDEKQKKRKLEHEEMKSAFTLTMEQLSNRLSELEIISSKIQSDERKQNCSQELSNEAERGIKLEEQFNGAILEDRELQERLNEIEPQLFKNLEETNKVKLQNLEDEVDFLFQLENMNVSVQGLENELSELREKEQTEIAELNSEIGELEKEGVTDDSEDIEDLELFLLETEAKIKLLALECEKYENIVSKMDDDDLILMLQSIEKPEVETRVKIPESTEEHVPVVSSPTTSNIQLPPVPSAVVEGNEGKNSSSEIDVVN